MKGIWMWSDAAADADFARRLDACQRGGVTDVFFLTKGLSGKTAFLCEYAPALQPGQDLLQAAIDGCHARGMRLHAWFTSASDEAYKAAHPDAGRCHFTKGRDQGLISLTDAGYMDYMRRIIRDMTARYDVDGLHLDYIRYNHLLYGWGPEDVARYAACGVDVAHVKALMNATFYEGQDGAIFDAFRAGDESVIALSRVRRQDVLNLARALTGAAARPLMLSAALMPEGAYDDLAFADLHYGQHYDDLKDVCHMLLPMAYSKAFDKDEIWTAMVARGTAKFGRPVLAGLHAYEGGTGESIAKDAAAVSGLTGVKGVCLFREGAFVWAFSEGGKLRLYNPTGESVTRVDVVCGGEAHSIDMALAPGQETTAPLPASADCLRAYSGEKEMCIVQCH